MKIPIPFAGWIEEDEELLEFLKSQVLTKATTYTFGYERMKEIVSLINKLKQERDFYKNGFENADTETLTDSPKICN